VKSAEINGLKAPRSPEAPILRLNSVDGLILRRCAGIEDLTKQHIERGDF
jgi:hypothetical protein